MSASLQEKLQETLGAAYRIERELPGAGMSRVFVATEVELERTVVVKVLPPDLAAGINTERFRREIQLAAKLQHPHIVPLLFAGARGGLLYYTMPFIEGESLRARLTRGRELPVQEAVRLVSEVADALAYAHSRGVVHRDIKPENVLISGSHVVVTDFGVAKALTSATGETSLTSMGVALGTPAYMAPEQATADPLTDHRADIYALGVLLYELLAGRPPFTGTNPQQVLSAHVTSQPDPVTRHRMAVPPQLEEVVMRCLEKNPADRWQSADEVREQLALVMTPSGGMQPVRSSAASAPVTARATPQRIAVVAGAAGLLVAALVLSSIAFRGGGDEYVVGLTRQITSVSGREMQPALSPDGKIIAFLGISDTSAHIYIRYVDGGRTVRLTEGHRNVGTPIWSRDGTRIAFVDGPSVYTMPVLGGTPTQLVASEEPRWVNPAGWSPDGQRFAWGVETENAIYVGDHEARNARKIAAIAEPHSLSWSPDGRRLAVTSDNAGFIWDANLAPSSIWIVPVDGGEAVQVTDQLYLNTSPVWAEDGRSILFISSRGGGRDIYRLRIASDGKPIGDPTRLTTGLGPHTIAASPDGRLLTYATLTAISNVWTVPIPGSGRVTADALRAVTAGNQTIESAVPSRDGEWLAFDSNVNGNSDIYKMKLPTGEPQQLTSDPADDFNPNWSRDGSEIVFHSFRTGNRDLFLVSSDGARTEQVLKAPGHQRAGRWAGPRAIIYFDDSLGTGIVEREGGPGTRWGQPRIFMPSATHGLMELAPNGVQLADAFEGSIWVRSLSGEGRPVFDARAAGVMLGRRPAWSADSRTVYFIARERSGMSSVWAVPAAGGEARRVIELNDPAKQPYLSDITADARNLYLVLGRRESDVWVMELSKK